MDLAATAIVVIAVLGSGVMGGFFFALSVSVMGALGRLAPPQECRIDHHDADPLHHGDA